MPTRSGSINLEIEAEYWRLLAAGMGGVEACEQLGIGRKTGYRWRAESTARRSDCGQGHLVDAAVSAASAARGGRVAVAEHAIRQAGITIGVHALNLGRPPAEILAGVGDLAERIVSAGDAG
ncbi:hypothetical protein [Streptomyces sp. NBC_01803]|uniref:hypothetical protein n=1 Tax=Streptomyces sp. NBC_01803 TaxID=2975946 RepID=UPI002DD94ED5|nr:hypothetical protein [Streptomyces sp. NBC_01803]WSA45481.1 hypothetical protein OIE51_15515 [Streptomyces sp. NBC_01803]